MKKARSTIATAALAAIAMFFLATWLPAGKSAAKLMMGLFGVELADSFKVLSIILAVTLALVAALALPASFVSVLRPTAGRIIRALLDVVESVPAMLVALVAYAPFAMAMALGSAKGSSDSSIAVFCSAAAITALPEAVRRVSIVLYDLYNRRYSFAFRSYGIDAAEIILTLLGTREMLATMRGAAVNVLLKMMILDSSFGFLVQLGFGSFGRPAHASPGALIAAWRTSVVTGENPERFWIPVAILTFLTFVFVSYTDPEDRQ